jgi:small-conductance mechanosensitive channel
MRRLSAALLLVLAVGMPCAQEQAGTPGQGAVTEAAPKAVAEVQDQAATTAPDEAPVRFANRTVAVLRATFMGIGPGRRAQRAEAAIAELVAAGGDGKVGVQVEPQGHVLLIDGQLAFFLVVGDADRLRGQTLAQASQAARLALQRAMDETREGRDVARLVHAAGLSLLATVVALALIALAWRGRRWARDRVAALVARGGSHLQVGGAPIVQIERLVAVIGVVVRILSWAIALAVVYQWFTFVFSEFPYTRPWGEGLRTFLLDAVARLGKGTLHALPDLVIAIAILLLARGVVGLARPIFGRIAASRGAVGGWLDADTALPTQRLFNVAVALFAIVMAYPYLPGSDSEAFKGMSVLVGLVVTLGGSSLFGQAASGLVIIYSRTLRVGEYVRIGDHEGTVTGIGAFTIRVRTGLGEELTLPNALVLGTVTKNYSRAVRGSGYIVDTVVTIGYDAPWRQVEAMLIEAARRTRGVLAEPAPRVFQTGLSDFYPEYRLVCQASPTEPRPRAEVLSVLHANIQDVFNQYGVQIMSPHYVGDPAAAKVVPRQGWYAAPARHDDGAAGTVKG